MFTISGVSILDIVLDMDVYSLKTESFLLSTGNCFFLAPLEIYPRDFSKEPDR